VRKAVLIAAVPPLMLRTPSNPEGLPIEVFDKIRAGVAGDRSQYYKELAIAFYGANRPEAKVSQGTLDQFWLWSMQAGAINAYESVKAFSETDFTEDLKKFDVATLVLHGEDDQLFRSRTRRRSRLGSSRAPRKSTTRALRTASPRPIRIRSTPTCSRSLPRKKSRVRLSGLVVFGLSARCLLARCALRAGLRALSHNHLRRLESVMGSKGEMLAASRCFPLFTHNNGHRILEVSPLDAVIGSQPKRGCAALSIACCRCF